MKPMSSMASSSKTETSKTPKLCTKNNPMTIDRISQLPDPLLCCILSFLTTKEAVATSILSTRWQNLWKWVPIIDFDDRDFVMLFGEIVNKVMLSKQVRCITAFRLKWNDDNPYAHYDSKLPTWICSAVSEGVEEVDICIERENAEDFEVPPSIFSCNTLTILKLKNHCWLHVSSSVQLPRLKVLHLLTVIYEDTCSFDNLISACPVLDELVIERCDRDRLSGYEIISTTLTTLVVDHTKIQIYPAENYVSINTPALKYLVLTNVIFEEPPTTKLNNLVEAKFDVGGRSCKSSDWTYMLMILYELLDVKILHLGSGIVKTLTAHNDEFHLCKLNNLVKLTVESYECFPALVEELLINSPHLQQLIIKKIRQRALRSLQEPHRRLPLDAVPHCLAFHLQHFQYQGFQGFQSEMSLLTYIWEHSQLMVDMSISSSPYSDVKKSYGTVHQLTKLTKGSPGCRLLFDDQLVN